MSESDSGRTPHPDQPAESGAQEPAAEGSGRTPHPEQPAEGAEEAGGEGADTPS
ncbi:hypothetical protein [Blastococcus sp. SYSU D00813]